MMRQVNTTSLGDDALETLTIAGLEKAKERNNTYVCVLHKLGQCCVQVWISTANNVDSISQPTPMEVGAVMSTCACCGKAEHDKAKCRFRNAKCSNCGKTGHLRAMCRQREKSAGKSNPSSSSGKSFWQRRHEATQTSATVVDRSFIDDLIAPRRNESCSLCGKRGHLSHVCRSSGENASARAVEVEPAEPVEEREIQHLWAMSVCDISGIRWTFCLFCDNSDLPSDEFGNLLNMIMYSGAEEHVVSLADWKSLGEPLLKPAQVRLRSAAGDDMGVSGSFMVRGWCNNQMLELTALVATRATRSLCPATKVVSAGYSVEMRPTESVLPRSGGGCILLQRCGKRDFLSIGQRKSCKINAITFSTMKREVQSLKSELRALRTSHLSTSEVRLPWTPEEKHRRHEVNGHARE